MYQYRRSAAKACDSTECKKTLCSKSCMQHKLRAAKLCAVMCTRVTSAQPNANKASSHSVFKHRLSLPRAPPGPAGRPARSFIAQSGVQKLGRVRNKNKAYECAQKRTRCHKTRAATHEHTETQEHTTTGPADIEAQMQTEVLRCAARCIAKQRADSGDESCQLPQQCLRRLVWMVRSYELQGAYAYKANATRKPTEHRRH